VIKFIFSLVFAAFSLPVLGACTFPTSQFIEEMQMPSRILRLDIRVDKSKKWAKNLLQIVASPEKNINKKFKKKFKAEVTVVHDFGTCKWKAVVRQSGDWKDHVSTNGYGQAFNSLDIDLKSGSILNAVSFKLLVPATRKNEYEILTTTILRRLGFLAPETFSVKASVNNAVAGYIFQENPEKEMLERNRRREGPLYEGDESILWNYRDFQPLQLANLSLARLLNKKWAARGEQSSQIALKAFLALQRSYLNRAVTMDLQFRSPFDEGDEFAHFGVVLLAAGGWHGLAPHNLKFYFNALRVQMESVYYDGNTEYPVLSNQYYLKAANDFAQRVGKERFGRLLTLVRSSAFERDVIREFSLRSNREADSALRFVREHLGTFRTNLIAVAAYGDLGEAVEPSEVEGAVDVFLQRLDRAIPDTSVYYYVSANDEDRFALKKRGDESVIRVGGAAIAGIMSRNKLEGSRATLIAPLAEISESVKANALITKPFSGGTLRYTAGALIQLDEHGKSLTFIQNEGDDRLVIEKADLSGWQLRMLGKDERVLSTQAQRFDTNGLTGCVTLIDSTLENTTITAHGGSCEDTVNIVGSSGHMAYLEVSNAMADAFDADFSDLTLGRALILNAGNDCIDVSGGVYRVDKIEAVGCGDKAVSVGERSDFFVDYLNVSDVSTGVASKDSSVVKVWRMVAVDTAVCGESMVKKQEFGGAILHIGDMACLGPVNADASSEIKLGR